MVKLSVTSKHFDSILYDTYEHAVAARTFAVSLEAEAPKVARVWHALADRLHEAAEQAANMDRVVVPVAP